LLLVELVENLLLGEVLVVVEDGLVRHHGVGAALVLGRSANGQVGIDPGRRLGHARVGDLGLTRPRLTRARLALPGSALGLALLCALTVPGHR
jgi:hypothetical protein